MFKYLLKTVKKSIRDFNKSSRWTKIVFFLGITLILVIIANRNAPTHEGYSGIGQTEKFVSKTSTDIFDPFYTSIYDDLVYDQVEIKDTDQQINSTNTEEIKLNLLNEEVEILEESNLKFFDKIKKLETEINNLNNNITNLQRENNLQKSTINQIERDEEELEFLRLNLLYSNKCQSKKLFSTGYKVGTKEYKDCIMNKGKKNR